MNGKHVAARLGYTLLFWLIIPIIMIGWAVTVEEQISMPSIHSETAGMLLAGTGLLLILWAALKFWVTGNGLPMNAFPPKKKIISGPYRLFHDPIYIGAAFIGFGISLYTGSSSGFWLITPTLILCMGALVLGYERLDLHQRFGESTSEPLFSVPALSNVAPTIANRVAKMLLLLLVWSSLNWLVNTIIAESQMAYHPFSDAEIRSREMWISVLSFILTVLYPLTSRTKSDLRDWVVRNLIGLFLVAFFSFMLFGVSNNYGLTGNVLQSGTPWVFNPPLIVVWITMLTLLKRNTGSAILMATLLALVILIEFLMGSATSEMHLVTLIFTTLAVGHKSVWKVLRKVSEAIANSWKEWVIGPVRIINHGFYVGFAAFAGITLAGFMTGSLYAWAILVFSITVVVFSALWAQIIEGSEKLKRPYGYYGALVGIIFGSGILWLMNTDVWLIIAVVSVLMPWVQAIGRLRCLINGCCHGAPTDNPRIGIRYHHHRSRVTNISGLKGELLYPTPLFSILWLFFCGFVLLKLWYSQMSPSFILGMYLILTGIGRFAEEAYRGEVQTKILYGLRLYQWTAILSVLIGIGITFWRTSTIYPDPGFNLESLYAGLIGGFFVFFAMGVDFPYSNARFSRLV